MESFSITLRTSSNLDKYPARSHARRVAKKLGAEDGGLIALQGTASAYYSNSDLKVPFRQDRYFYYLSGCNEPDCHLTYDVDKDVLTLYLPPINFTRFVYDGRGSTIEEALEKYDIDKAVYIKSVDDSFTAICADSNTLTVMERGTLAAGGTRTALKLSLDACRSVKDEHEIGLIRKANDISAAAHRDVLLKLHTCKSETEAEAVYMRRCLASSAKEQAYGPIFGSGTNASFLHYIDNDSLFKNSQLLLVDAGCEWQHYASDVTRTIPLNKNKPGYWPSEEARKLYEAVESIQEHCIREMKPGVTFGSVNVKAAELSVDALLELGILKGDRQDILKRGTARAFFLHGLGHHMGLEVHDTAPPPIVSQSSVSGTYWQEQQERMHPQVQQWNTANLTVTGEPVMEAGNVITVEPGLYFNKFFLETFVLPDQKHREVIDLEVLKRYMPVGGVRIEDDILITKNGNENLTTAAKGAEILKILRNAASVW